MIGIAASLLGIGKWLREAATALFGIIARHPWQAGLIAALLLAGWQWRGKNEALEDAARWKASAAAEKAAHAQTVTNYREASKRAQQAAEAKKRAIEAEHKRIADHADENYAALRSQYRALLLQRTAKADSSSANGTGMSERSEAAGLPENSAGPAGFYISGSDGLRTADLGAYATACYRWADEVAKSSTPRTESP